MGQRCSTRLLLPLIAILIAMLSFSLTRLSLTRSLPLSLPSSLLSYSPPSLSCPAPSLSRSFSAYLRHRAKPRPPICAVTMASGSAVDPSATFTDSDNPLLKDFDFPPFDVVQPSHVRPGIKELIRRLEGDLVELEKTVEPTWPKLVEPLERIVDRLQVVWGVVNHLKAVKDSSELRSAIEEVQVA